MKKKLLAILALLVLAPCLVMLSACGKGNPGYLGTWVYESTKIKIGDELIDLEEFLKGLLIEPSGVLMAASVPEEPEVPEPGWREEIHSSRLSMANWSFEFKADGVAVLTASQQCDCGDCEICDEGGEMTQVITGTHSKTGNKVTFYVEDTGEGDPFSIEFELRDGKLVYEYEYEFEDEEKDATIIVTFKKV